MEINLLNLLLLNRENVCTMLSNQDSFRCYISYTGTWIRDSYRQWDSVFFELNSGFQIAVFRIPLEYCKILKISPSKYNPLKLVTEKTLR